METINNAATYVSETVKGAVSGTSKEANKEVAKDNNAGVFTRAGAAKDAVSDKLNESGHDAKADANKPGIPGAAAISNAATYVSETVQGALSGTSKEANKEVAKDSNAGVFTRVQAGKDALSDKLEQSGHDAKADVNKPGRSDL